MTKMQRRKKFFGDMVPEERLKKIGKKEPKDKEFEKILKKVKAESKKG